jgi:MFS family permease
VLVPTGTAPPGFRTGTWVLDDLADNMSIAMLIAAVLLVIGGIAAGFRWRWGSGLAGGAGLALTGLVALAIGLAEFPIDAARDFAAIPNAQQFTLTITREIGYWLLIAAAALGIVVFFASINEAFGDRRSGLNPWIAALGALATVVAMFGPMIPEGTAVFSDNWYLIEGPGEPSALLLVGRLVQLALLAITGVAGYLCVRRWGLAVAIGGALPIVWLAASTLFDLTDTPVGPAYANPGADEIELHGVTIIGVSAIVAIAILAVVAAYDQSVRERRS